MWSYALKRGRATLVTLASASVIIFGFIHLIPGDPIYVLLGDIGDTGSGRATARTAGARSADLSCSICAGPAMR